MSRGLPEVERQPPLVFHTVASCDLSKPPRLCSQNGLNAAQQTEVTKNAVTKKGPNAEQQTAAAGFGTLSQALVKGGPMPPIAGIHL